MRNHNIDRSLQFMFKLTNGKLKIINTYQTALSGDYHYCLLLDGNFYSELKDNRNSTKASK